MTIQAAMRTANGGAQADRLGVICSVACAVHCAAMPLLLAMLPSLALTGWLSDPLFHQIVAAMCALLVYRAIWPAWAVHRNRLVAASAAGGIALVCLSSFVLPSCCSGEFGRNHLVQPSSVSAIDPALACKVDHGASVVGPGGRCVACAHDTELAEEPNEPDFALAGLHQFHSRPLLQHDDLYRLLGDDLSLHLLGVQPYLNPLGGCLLILAHVLNARQRRARRCGCGC